MKKRMLAVLLVAAVMAMGTLSGCENKPEEGNVASSGKEGQTNQDSGSGEKDYTMYQVTDPIEIEFWYNGSTNAEFYDKVAADFNSSQDLITVTAVCAGNYNAIKEKIVAAQTAGTGLPAICAINAPSLPTYVESGVAENLDDYLAANEVDTSDFVKGFLDQATLHGSVYGLPHGPSAVVYYYNKTELEKHGLEKFPQTWDEFKKWVKDVYEATGKPAVTCAGLDGGSKYNMILNFGGELIKEDGSTTNVDPSKQYFMEYRDLVKAGYINWTLEEGQMNAFLAGETMAIDTSCTDYDTLMTDDFELGMAWPYMAEQNLSTVAGCFMFMPAANDQKIKNAGAQFLVYLTSADVNLEWAKFSSYITTHYSTIQDEAKMEAIYEELPLLKVVYEHVDDIILKVQNKYYDSVIKVFTNGLAQIFLEDVDGDAAWQAMVDEMNYILAGN
ncbi:MAG: extracellular solute-binding protein [Hungatella sp.]|nr:extracellular solute-binding protein [Hungatella sp.]